MLRAAKVIRCRKGVIELLYDNQKNEELDINPLISERSDRLALPCRYGSGRNSAEKALHIQTNEAMLYWGRACLLILAGVCHELIGRFLCCSINW